MSQEPSKIVCPNCGEEIDVNEILYHQLDGEIRKKYNDELAQQRKMLEQGETRLRDDRAAIERDRAEYQENLHEAVRQGLEGEKARLEKRLKKQAEQEQASRVASLEDELQEKSRQVEELNRSKAEIERLKREKAQLRDEIELDAQKRLNEQLNQEKGKIRKFEEDRARLQISEKEQLINQLRDQLQEAQRKAEQGSMQLQGEVQELAIEEWLSGKFPLDSITEIKKGERGADCLQTVHTHARQNCGSIYYESKRTKTFQPGWIEKFKADIRDKNADIGVLVTEAMPADMQRLGLRDGIWVCSFDEFKGLCAVLRESIIQISNAMVTQENKGDKMGMLYDFLTGNEFRMQVEAIVEGFTQMKSDLESERRSMTGIWKKREKQIDKVLLNTNHMYNSVKGIAGNAVQTVALLELPAEEDNDD